MGFADDMRDDVAEILGAEFTERVFLLKTGTNPRGVDAVVERESLILEDGTIREALLIRIPRRWPDGSPTITEGEHQIEVPLRLGETPTRCRVNRIVASDAAMILLEVIP